MLVSYDEVININPAQITGTPESPLYAETFKYGKKVLEYLYTSPLADDPKLRNLSSMLFNALTILAQKVCDISLHGEKLHFATEAGHKYVILIEQIPAQEKINEREPDQILSFFNHFAGLNSAPLLFRIYAKKDFNPQDASAEYLQTIFNKISKNITTEILEHIFGLKFSGEFYEAESSFDDFVELLNTVEELNDLALVENLDPSVFNNFPQSELFSMALNSLLDVISKNLKCRDFYTLIDETLYPKQFNAFKKVMSALQRSIKEYSSDTPINEKTLGQAIKLLDQGLAAIRAPIQAVKTRLSI